MSDSPKTVTINLSEPITYKEQTYTSLTFRRRKAKDLVAMDLVKGEMRKHMAMLASMAGVPLPVIEELDAEDYEAASKETIAVMGKSVAKAVKDAETAAAKAEAETEEPSDA
tara:strand:- start:119 stop:454 length:336 start_codon:yes stop_codon:yes gene_type:complete